MKSFPRSKKYVYVTLAFLMAFALYHLSVWYGYTSKIFDVKPYHIGDLARMAYQIDSLHPRKEQYTLPVRHLNKESWDGNNVDILTIGDSFFNGGALGKNPYFQDYLASKTGKKILNIQSPKTQYDAMDTINILINNGWLDKIHPKMIILESVEREVVHLYARPHNFSLNEEMYIIKNGLFENKCHAESPEVSIINTGNYKFPFYNFLYRYNNHAQEDVYKLPLSSPLFSVKANDTLLIYTDDIKRLKLQTHENIAKANENFNRLSDKLQQHNITLCILVATDKYDLYYDFLTDKQLEKNNFFNDIEKMEKRYIFINTKQILLPFINAHVKDIYYADDTHWSFKASEIIANDKNFNLWINNK